MPLDIGRVRQCLQKLDLRTLFIQELGWDRYSANLPVAVDGTRYSLQAIAEKRGFQVFECPVESDRTIPDHSTRGKIERQVARSAHEHIIIYTDASKSVQKWQWVRRELGRPLARREYDFSKGQTGELLAQKLQYLAVELSEEEGLTLVDVTRRARRAFDVDRVTKRFYDRFKGEHATFLKFVKGITETSDREWYASLMLNRLMFIYFIQKKGFLDGDADYLRNRLTMVRERKGRDKFLTFYRYFLLRLFHEGLGQPLALRKKDLDELLGEVPYLNGGLFDVHELEQTYPEIQISDGAFECLFGFFDAYQWHLDERPLRADNEINPDVLGYIFEKYINQKQMGAYYTKEDITGYIARNTVIPFLFNAAEKKCAIAFKPGSAVWRLLADHPDRYIYEPVRRGVVDERGGAITETALPDFVREGMHDPKKRMFERRYNLGEADLSDATGKKLTLPTETWREYVERRKRCLELRAKLGVGEITNINDLITRNLDICQFAEDVIENCEGPELLRAFYHAIEKVSVLDPACGSGAFLFAALNVLEPLYEACLDRMSGFLEDLQRSGQKHHPEKFSDFRRILNEVARHPNRRYFILKSIIINNLYGVDIMEEAVEICKLRLFLKLAAQVDTVRQVEPLPDVDFNIRPGNTLVGFTKADEVRKAFTEDKVGQGKLLLGDAPQAFQRFEEEVEVTDRAFQKFREMQTEYDMDAEKFAEAKVELRRRLDALRDELDRYLAGEYGVNGEKAKEYDKWRNSYQPFHWFAEFYGILSNGGFDVIIGNPPWVEKREVQQQYTVRGYATNATNNLYAYVTERSVQLLNARGFLGLIVPLSSMSTDRFQSLQNLLLTHGTVWLSNYDDRPSRLFEALEHVQPTIILLQIGRRAADVVTANTTRCFKWAALERPFLFELVVYASISRTYLEGSVPKAGSEQEVRILDRLWSKNRTLGAHTTNHGKHVIFYTRKVHAFLNVLDFVPDIRDGSGKRRDPSEQKTLPFADPLYSSACLCTLNSSLFRWFLATFSDCRNINRREALGFPIELGHLVQRDGEVLAEFGSRLSSNLRKTSEVRSMSFGNQKLKVQCIIPKHSKSIIDEIDHVLARHYGFTAEELDFIINYDIKYRMGQNAEEVGDEGEKA